MTIESTSLMSQLPLWGYRARRKGVLEARSRSAIEMEIVTHALRSPDFRRDLLADPRAALLLKLDIEISDDFTLSVVEESHDRVYLVIPANPYPNVDEEQLRSTLGITFEQLAESLIGQSTAASPATRARVSLIARTWMDADFREALQTSPREAVEAELGTRLDYDQEVVVLWEEPHSGWLVIPLADSLDYAGIVAGTVDEQDWLRVNVAQAGSGEPKATTRWRWGTKNGEIFGICCYF